MKYRLRVVENCITYTSSGKFEVRVRVNTVYRGGTFPTLSEARRHRDELVAMRQPREERTRTKENQVKQTFNHSAEATQRRKAIREMIRKAPKAKVDRDGQRYTLVSLPDADREVM